MIQEMRVGDLVKLKDGREGWVTAFRSAEEQAEAWERQEEDRRWQFPDTPPAEEPYFERLAIVTFEDDSTAETSPEDLEITTPKVYVNIYLEDRAFGGHEEGGWWYDCGRCVGSYRCRDEAEAQRLFQAKLAWAQKANKARRSDISSVLSEGRYEVELQAWPGEDWPAITPRYQ